LRELGALDFAGGIVIHATAGIAALVGSLIVGRRRNSDSGTIDSHNKPFVWIGGGLLWFGWFGFNAGSELASDAVSALAFYNTTMAAATAALTWMILDWAVSGKPKLIGFCTGAVAGLATVTPTAGYVPTWAGFIIGIIASLVCFGAIFVKNKFKLDDALDVFGVHGVGGMTGSILLGLFSSLEYNTLDPGQDGLVFGGAAFFGKQIAAVFFCATWSFLWTYGILFVIDKIPGLGVKIKNMDHQENLDDMELGEASYVYDDHKETKKPEGQVSEPEPESIDNGSYIFSE